jgi:hypothetical protein
MALVSSGIVSTPLQVNWDVIPGESLKQLQVHQIQYTNNSDETAELGWGEMLPVFPGLYVNDTEWKSLPGEISGEGPDQYATGVLNLTADVTLTRTLPGTSYEGDTFTIQVIAPAANPTNTVLATFGGTAAATTLTITPNDGTNNPANVQATGTINLTDDIVLTSVAAGAGRNTNTFTIQVLAAAANPTDTVLVTFAGTAAAITCTVTPNDGTNNGAVAVDLTTAELVELINTGAVAGKTVTVTDGSGYRNDQTATGGGATVLVDAGEGDGAAGTFAGGTTVAVTCTTANMVELINTGAVTGKTFTVTDSSNFRIRQTATGGGATPLADGGEGDGVAATFAGGFAPITISFPKQANVVGFDIDTGATAAIGLEYWDGSAWAALTPVVTPDMEATGVENLIFQIPSDWALGGGKPGHYSLKLDAGDTDLIITSVKAGRILDKIGAVPTLNAGVMSYPIRPLGLMGSEGLFSYAIQTDDGDPADNEVQVDYESI